MPTLDDAFPTLHQALVKQLDRSPERAEQHGPFAAMIGALLARELKASSAAAAVAALDEAGLLSPERLAAADVMEIRDTLLETGVAASAFLIAPLKQIAVWIVEHHAGRVESLFNPERSTDWLRGELVAVPGISLAAADAILLFALKRPAYPVDRPTFRVLVRHGWLDPSATYEEARELLVHHATSGGDRPDGQAVKLLIELSAGMAPLGREFCRAAAPRCEQCPLESLLPEGGPRDSDG